MRTQELSSNDITVINVQHATFSQCDSVCSAEYVVATIFVREFVALRYCVITAINTSSNFSLSLQS